MVVCCECSTFLKMDPNNAILYENTLLNTMLWRNEKCQIKKLKRKSTNPIYLGEF
jgi:hypothetical protein